MNTVALHAATEALATYLSEVTAGDLAFPTPCEGWDVGDLYRHLLEENIRFGVAVTGDRAAPGDLAGLLNASSAGRGAHPDIALEAAYRRTASFMEKAFASTADPDQLREVAGIAGPRTIHDLYEMQLCDTVIHTWDLTRATGFECEVDDVVARAVLRRMELVPDAARGKGKAFGPVRGTSDPGHSVLERIVLLSGRTLEP